MYNILIYVGRNVNGVHRTYSKTLGSKAIVSPDPPNYDTMSVIPRPIIILLPRTRCIIYYVQGIFLPRFSIQNNTY